MSPELGVGPAGTAGGLPPARWSGPSNLPPRHSQRLLPHAGPSEPPLLVPQPPWSSSLVSLSTPFCFWAAPPLGCLFQALGSWLPSPSPLAGCVPLTQPLGVALPARSLPWGHEPGILQCSWHWAGRRAANPRQGSCSPGVPARWTENLSSRVLANLGAEGS